MFKMVFGDAQNHSITGPLRVEKIMKEGNNMTKFYNSKWFIPIIAIAWLLLVTLAVYLLFDHFHLWFALAVVFGLWIFIKIVSSIMKTLFHLS